MLGYAHSGFLTTARWLVKSTKDELAQAMVGRCRLTLSKPTLKAPGTRRFKLQYDKSAFNFASILLSNSTCASTTWRTTRGSNLPWWATAWRGGSFRTSTRLTLLFPRTESARL